MNKTLIRTSSFGKAVRTLKKSVSLEDLLVFRRTGVVKKPRTAFNFFCMQHYEDAKYAYDKYGLSVSSSLKTMWFNSTVEEKKVFNIMEQNEKRRFKNGEVIYTVETQLRAPQAVLRKRPKSFENRKQAKRHFFVEEKPKIGKWKKFVKNVKKFFRR